jgi:hypothetical protein
MMTAQINDGSPRRERKAAFHFSMILMLFVPLYRGLQWRTVDIIMNARSNIAVDVKDKRNDIYIGEATSHEARRVHTASLLSPPRDSHGDDSSANKVDITGTNGTNANITTANQTVSLTDIQYPIDSRDDTTTSFLPQNLALPKRIPCGKEKCFFRLKSNKNVAYLVSRFEDHADRQERFETLQAGWKLATLLEQEYQINHFLLAPPETIIISSELESRMNTNLWSEKYETNTYKTKKKKRYIRGTRAFIQKVQVAPSNPLLVGCAASKLQPFFKHVDAYKRAVRYPESYAQNVQQGFNASRKMLQKEPCLIKDFQIMLDTKGRVFHLDFDRCFKPDHGSEKYVISQEEIDSCLGILNDVERQLLESFPITAKVDYVSTNETATIKTEEVIKVSSTANSARLEEN